MPCQLRVCWTDKHAIDPALAAAGVIAEMHTHACRTTSPDKVGGHSVGALDATPTPTRVICNSLYGCHDSSNISNPDTGSPPRVVWKQLSQLSDSTPVGPPGADRAGALARAGADDTCAGLPAAAASMALSNTVEGGVPVAAEPSACARGASSSAEGSQAASGSDDSMAGSMLISAPAQLAAKPSGQDARSATGMPHMAAMPARPSTPVLLEGDAEATLAAVKDRVAAVLLESPLRDEVQLPASLAPSGSCLACPIILLVSALTCQPSTIGNLVMVDNYMSKTRHLPILLFLKWTAEMYQAHPQAAATDCIWECMPMFHVNSTTQMSFSLHCSGVAGTVGNLQMRHALQMCNIATLSYVLECACLSLR